MKIVNGKISEATEEEMFDYYLTRDWDTVMSFREWLRECEEQGTKVTNKQEVGREMDDDELEQATRELNSSIDEVVRYMNNRSDFFIVNVGAFEIRFDLTKLGKPKEEGVAE